ncbi:MAG: efflux RND transporter periplasmic adaptor subunit [candidate division KSB1 bacterium]|nr:efflux RND transporter periplasmic adaptor subunit [candidate division KSB1 bacterium]
MKKRIIGLAIVFVLLGLVVLRIVSEKSAVRQPAAARGGPIAVKAHVLIPERLEDKIVVTGSLQPNEAVDLRSEVSGKVMAIYFQEGSRVKKGDLLLQINDAELQAQLQRTLFQKELAAGTERRQRQQLEIEAVSQETYEAALNRLNVLEAEVKLLEAQLQKTKITAPFSGRIGLRFVSEGSYVSPNTVIANLVDSDPIKIEFTVPERYASAVRPGLEINFRVQGQSEIRRAVVYAVEPKIDETTRTLYLRAKCPNPDGRLVPGSFAQVELLLNVDEQALLVPSQALIPEMERQIVYVYRSGKAVPTPVETGIRTQEKVQLLRGAAAGDTVITSGILLLRPNAPVRISAFE